MTGQEQGVHGCQQQERTALRGGGSLQHGEDLGLVGHPPADGGVRRASVAFDHRGEGAEVVRQGLLDQHGEVLGSLRPGTRGQAWTVTKVPRGVRGYTTWALPIGISTQPSLWGKP